MATSINTLLTNLASDYYVSPSSAEGQKIDLSVYYLKARLNGYFGTDIHRIIEFGSYKRDTLLPRRYDEHSDVDLMVVFNTGNRKLAPETYRSRLADFASYSYSRSEVYRSHPTVVLELEHIKYDLVPTVQEYPWWQQYTPVLSIPGTTTTWQDVDPISFDNRLTAANSLHHSNIKRLIRLMKAWNAKADYPFESFQLEQEIVAMPFYSCVSLQQYFFFAIENLSRYNRSAKTASCISALQANCAKVRNAVDFGTPETAAAWLAHILPMS
jgi:predicted nucleotidyltransferase